MNEAHGHDEASGVKRRRYVPDCGTRTHKFLSYAAAIQTRKFWKKHPCFENAPRDDRSSKN